MNIAYYLVDALPAIAAGIVALWAATSTRHWFVRTSGVIASLLALLLIPAYELIISFGTEMLTIVVGMRIWRQRSARLESAERTHFYSRQATQISLKSLLLLMVVVGVVMAVLAQFPSLNWFKWTTQAASGLIAGVLTLLCVWIVLGKSRRWIRVVAALLIWAVASIGISIIELAAYGIWYSVSGSTKFWDFMFSTDSQVWLWDRVQYWMSTLAIAMSVLCTWLYLWVRSGWYRQLAQRADRPVAAPSPTGRARWSRGVLLALTLAVLVLPLYLFWKLLTPPPYSQERIRMPSGYPELILASQIIDESTATRLMRTDLMSNQVLANELDLLAPAIARMRRAISDSAEYTERTVDDDEFDAGNLHLAISATLDLAKRLNSPDRKLEACVDYLLFMDVFSRANSPKLVPFWSTHQAYALYSLWECRHQLQHGQAKEAAITLYEIDGRRIPWPTIEKHLKLDNVNSGWESHLQSLLDDWHGYDRFANDRLSYLSNVARMRVLSADLAIQAFRDDHDRLPRQLDELVPDYLPAVLLDPFRDAPLVYCVASDGFKLYSVGPNLRDDGGQAFDANTNQGDLVADSLYAISASGSATSTTGTASSSAESDVAEENLDAADANPHDD